jgi:cellobiose phosphorylase
MALLYAQPDVTRQHILLCASHQFEEGDVQHWWHPPVGRGVRTRCSDDFVWLPFVTSRYILATGDSELLNVKVPYLQGRQLNHNEESYYDLPVVDDREATVYEHCKKSIIHAFRYGEHGLPLMGSGDWNDGMNLVGIQGKGESVWLAFFIYDALNRFIKLAELQHDQTFADQCRHHASRLKQNINEHGWDDAWYLRAYFDDGTPLGSKSSEECKIDSISQSWSVLSDAGDTSRSLRSMKAVETLLIREEDKLIQLLDPPFDKAIMDPGYIKGYVPGVRENGGQYTHAAIWIAMAFAKLRDQDKTETLLRILSPIHHSDESSKLQKYKVEPYVMPADIYGVDPHTGRGGWTWYTGSAGWMYQFVLESMLGFSKTGDTLRINSCIPKSWKSFQITYRHMKTEYSIEVIRIADGHRVSYNVDGIIFDDGIPLLDDGKDHKVTVELR